jgi:hypothetical protein
MTGKPPWQPASFESVENDRTDLPSTSTALLVVVVGVAIILALLFLFLVVP